jgi:hypothetical protein
MRRLLLALAILGCTPGNPLTTDASVRDAPNWDSASDPSEDAGRDAGVDAQVPDAAEADAPMPLSECALGVPGNEPPACDSRFLTCRLAPDGATACGPTGSQQILALCDMTTSCDREMQCLAMGAGDDTKCWYFCRLDGSTSCPIGPSGAATRCLRPDELLFPGESATDPEGRPLPIPPGVGFCY